MKTEENLVVISSDIDWAGDEIISYMLEILDKYDFRATFFCTRDVSSVNGIKKHELAIHPNFIGDKPEIEVIRKLKKTFPEAKGIRGHCFYHHNRLFQVYRDFGLEYDSNLLIPNQVVRPFYALHDIVRIPVFFTDSTYIFSTSPDFNLASLNMKDGGLRVFNFHPVHVFLNTVRPSDYEAAKKYIQEPNKILKFRKSERGICDLFIELLEYIKYHGLKTCTLYEVNESYRRQTLRV